MCYGPNYPDLIGRSEARAAMGCFSLGGTETVAQWKMDSPADAPTYLAYRERLYEGLRKAGTREE